MSSKILNQAQLHINQGIIGKHCWDWVSKVFQGAGVSKEKIFVGSQFPQSWQNQNKSWTSNHGNPFLPREYYDHIRAGDWILIHNKNPFDSRGNHSALFVRWEDREKGIALVADNNGANKAGAYRKRNLFKDPIVMILRSLS